MGRQFEPALRILTLLCMGGLAGAGIVIAADPIRHYGDLSRGALVYYAISLAGGVALLLCLLMALRFPAKLHKVAGGGLSAAVILLISA